MKARDVAVPTAGRGRRRGHGRVPCSLGMRASKHVNTAGNDLGMASLQRGGQAWRSVRVAANVEHRAGLLPTMDGRAVWRLRLGGVHCPGDGVRVVDWVVLVLVTGCLSSEKKRLRATCVSRSVDPFTSRETILGRTTVHAHAGRRKPMRTP